MTFRRPPLPGKDLGAWARQMYEYMSSQSPVQGSVNPTPLLLAHLTDGQVARAATDGVIMFDPVAGEVVVSIGGAFVTLGPMAAFTLPDVIAAGSAGDADSIPQITVDAKGRVTALSQIDVSIAAAKINDSTAAGRAMLLAADAAVQTALLDTFTSALKGLSPASGGGTKNFLRADGSWADPADSIYERSAVVATTSGTAHDFTGMAITVEAIDVHLRGVSLSGADHLLIQLLNSSGVPITSGYLSATTTTDAGALATTSSTAGCVLWAGEAGAIMSGLISFRRFPGETNWTFSHTAKRLTTKTSFGGGDVAAAANVSGVRITRTGANTFDAGSAFVEWRE